MIIIRETSINNYNYKITGSSAQLCSNKHDKKYIAGGAFIITITQQYILLMDVTVQNYNYT